MNRYIALGVGFSLTTLIMAGLGTLAMYGLILFVGYQFYILFFARSIRTTHTLTGYYLILGTVISLELLGPGRFGYATLWAAATVSLSVISKRWLQFASPYARFTIALLLAYSLFDLLIFPGKRTVNHLLLVSIPIIFSLITFYFSYSSSSRRYENV